MRSLQVPGRCAARAPLTALVQGRVPSPPPPAVPALVAGRTASREGVARSMNKGDKPSRRGHRGETFPKMAAGAQGGGAWLAGLPLAEARGGAGPEVRTRPHGRRAGARRAGEGEGRIRRSCDVGAGGFAVVTLGCWFHCRYNYAKQRIQERIAREGIKNKILYESTHLDPERKQSNSSS
ncbi:cytochrome c oxidase assembly protein COX20, mitochondrial isoform 1-T1 [Glossophaga mutica]